MVAEESRILMSLRDAPDLNLRQRARGNVSHFAQPALAQFSNRIRSEEHTSELQSLMRISYAVFCLKKKNKISEKQNDQDTGTNCRNRQIQHTKQLQHNRTIARPATNK